MSGKHTSWGWVPNLPAPIRPTVSFCAAKPQLTHSPDDLAKLKRYPPGAAGGKQEKYGFALAMDWYANQQVKS